MRPAVLLAALLVVIPALLLAAPAGAESDDAGPKAKPPTKDAVPPTGDAAPKAEPAGPPRKGSLRALGVRLEKLALRIAKAVEDAKRDPDWALLEIYRRYSAKELKTRKRQVRAVDLVRIMVDPSNDKELRARAQNLVSNGTLRGDIDLSSTNKRRGMSERSWFCRQEVVEGLAHEDREARRLTNELLMGWYNVRDVSAILGYKYDDKKSWPRAISAWRKQLRKN